MDELRAYFNNPRPSKSQMVKLRAGATDGFCVTKEDNLNKLDRQEAHRRTVALTGTDYARNVKQRENEMYLEQEQARGKWESISGGLESMEQLSSFGASVQNIENLNEEAMNEVYSKYSFEKKEDSKTLAIDMSKNEILDSIRGFPVTIIEGPTGCGKTTQVPQWILDSCYQARKPCKIIVTQPRRIAAISIAKRVAQERGWDVGGLVGYQVGLDRKASNDTRILYVTAGVLLQKLVAAKTMNEYTHVILDEIHERGQEMDFLLLVVKKLLYTVSPNVKVVLMSATFDKKAFSNYFMMSSSVVVEKANHFSVKTFYLNHLNKFGSILLQSTPKVDPMIAPEMHHLVIKLLNAFEQIDQHEYSYSNRDEADLPSVLIFLPGISEIEDLDTCLSDLNLRKSLVDEHCAMEVANYKWKVLPLHSTITAEEQVRVFLKATPGERKIILATNIAESSITVPDIKYVIDYCLMKILEADPQTNFTTLKLSWASKTNCEQRAGRAGRVRDGRVYRLVTDKFYESFRQECAPEIMRCPLERLVLLAKMLDMGTPSDVLALAMDPPDMSNIHRTVLVLKEIGGLKKTVNNEEEEWSPLDGDITYMGRVMAKLPLDVRASKLIVLGHIFGCLDECIIMAAAMSVKNMFNSPFKERLNAYNSKLTWADGSTSDCIASLNVYKVWNHLHHLQHFKQPGNNESQWARRFFVQMRALRDLDILVRELRMRLSRIGIDAKNTPSPWDKNEISLVLKVIIAGAVYPQYFVQVSQDEIRERDAVKILGGLDPRNTVYLQNFPDNQPGPIYTATIRNIVRNLIGDEPRVTFDKNSRKVYLTFADSRLTSQRSANSKDPTVPGQVVLPVYKAIKAYQLDMKIKIPLLPIERARELANALEMQKLDINKSLLVPRLPDIDYTYLELRITEMINVGRFWVQYDDCSTEHELRQIGLALNAAPLLALAGPAAPGLWCAGPFVDHQATTMHRVRVEALLPRDMVEVLFMDYGNVSRVSTSNLYVLPDGICRETPPLALQCRLAEIAPSPLLNQHGKWSDKAFHRFQELTFKKKLFGKVYSVTHGVVAIELLAGESHNHISVNQKLLDEHLAVPAEESFDSKLNHDLRQTANDLNIAQKHASNKEQNELAFQNIQEPDTYDTRECYTEVVLKGPRSPLETSVYNVMYSSRDKQVHIERNSVNSVLLDTEPQEVYERLLVAMEVGQSDKSSNLTLRYTTLMPNLPGLPAIIALLFCPVAELRRNVSGTRYVSTLCGLGSTETGTPLFPEHDILVNVDAELSVEDIGMINHIRYLMDYTMRVSENEQPVDGDGPSGGVAKIIRKDLMQLLQKRRKHVEPQSVERAWEWRSVPEEELLEITNPDMSRHTELFPLHAPQELRPEALATLQALHQHNELLKMLVAGSSVCGVGVEHVCKLCGTVPLPTHLMRMHLYSNAHRDRELDLRPVQS